MHSMQTVSYTHIDVYKRQTSTNETEEKIIGDALMTMERTRLAAMPEQRRLIYTLNRFENKTSPEIAMN